jgi:gluconate 2-dehydrogenase gamma chain
MAARIMPSTDTLGANEAGVIHFIDRALGAEFRDDLATLQDGLADLNDRVAKMFPEFSRLSELHDAAQDQVLKEIENESFFDDVWDLTITGFFAMSSYGGNKDNVAWDLLGFEGNHGAWGRPAIRATYRDHIEVTTFPTCLFVMAAVW